MTCQSLPPRRCDDTLQPIVRWIAMTKADGSFNGFYAAHELQVRGHLPHCRPASSSLCDLVVGEYQVRPRWEPKWWMRPRMIADH